MAAETADFLHLRDEDALRRLWQQTEDLSKKKEIRAHMYKLREQRLKEFYTTGEVFSDVQKATPQKSDLEIVPSNSIELAETGLKTMTHTDSIEDRGFMTMKSKEIRDSESPTRSHQFHNNRGGEGQTVWKVESSSESYHAVGRNGQYEIASQSHHRNMAGENDRITMDKAYSNENRSVMDRNGDVRVLSSREIDNSGRAMSQYDHRLDDRSNMRQLESGRHFDDFSDDHFRRIEDGSGRQNISNVSESRVSESRSSSSHVQTSSVQRQKWSSTSSRSSSSVVSSSDMIKDSGFQNERNFDSGNKDLIQYTKHSDGTKSDDQSMATTNISKRGVTEVKKTTVRGNKVITETTTYVDGVPKMTKTVEREQMPETITVIRGGKLIKETVPAKGSEDRSFTTSTTTTKTTSTSGQTKRNSTESFITSERRSQDREYIEDAETFITDEETGQPKGREPKPGKLSGDNIPQKNYPKQALPKTKTVIRGGKVRTEEIPSDDVELTDELIRHETSSTQQRKSQTISKKGTIDEQLIRREQYDSDRDRSSQPRSSPEKDGTRGARQPDSPRDPKSPRHSKIIDTDDQEREISEDIKRSSTKTVTVIRGGKLIKETVVDEERISDRPGQTKAPEGKRSSPDRREPKKGSHPDREEPHSRRSPSDTRNLEPDYDESEPESPGKPKTVKTVTVIRSGKLIKESVPASPEEANIPDDNQRPTGKSYPDDDQESKLYKPEGLAKELRQKTTKEQRTETKTTTVIRGGKIIKEKVDTVVKNVDKDMDDKVKRKPSDLSSRPGRKYDSDESTYIEDDDDDESRRKKAPSPSKKPDSRKQPQSEGRYPESDTTPNKEKPDYSTEDDMIVQKGNKLCKIRTIIRSGKVIKQYIPLTAEEIRNRKPEAKSPEPDHPGKIGRRPEDDHPGKVGRRPGDDQTDQYGRRPGGRRPEDDHPGKVGRRPGDDQPDQYGRRPDGRRPGDDQPDQYGRRPEGRKPEDDEPDQYGRRPDGRRPEDDHPGKVGRRPGDDQPDQYGRRPDGRRPGDDQPDQYGRRPQGRKPENEEPDQYGRRPDGRRPEEDQPGKVGRRPGDDQPDQYGRRPDGRRPEDDHPGKVGRRPGDDQPDQYSRRPGDDQPDQYGRRPDGRRPEDDEPDQYGRRPDGRRPGDDQPDQHGRRPDGRRPGDDQPDQYGRRPVGRRPEDDKPDQYGRRPDGRSPEEDHPGKVGRRPGDDQPDQYGRRPDGRRPEDNQPDQYGRKPGDEEPEDQVKTITVIRSGKVVKETVKLTEKEIRERKLQETQKTQHNKKIEHPQPESESPQSASPKKRPEDQKSRHSPVKEKPKDKISDGKSNDIEKRTVKTVIRAGKITKEIVTDETEREKEVQTNLKTPKGKKPDDDQPDQYGKRPDGRRPGDDEPDQYGRRPDSRRPEDDEPDQYGRRPDGRKPEEDHPGKVGRRPGDDQPDQYGRRPDGRRPEEDHPGKVGRRPGDDQPDQYGRRPDGRRPEDDHPGKVGKRPIDDKPDQYGRRPDGRKPEDDEPDQYGKRPDGRRPGDDKPDQYGRKPDGRRPEDDEPDQYGKRPDGRRPADDHPGKVGRRPGDDQPDQYGRRPDGSRPEDDHPEKVARRPENDEPQTQVKTVTVIRSGKVVKETVKVTDDEPEKIGRRPGDDKPDPYGKKPDGRKPGDDQPDQYGRRPDGRRPEDDHPGKIGRRPGDDQPDQYGRRPDGRKPGDDQPDQYERRPDGRRPGDDHPGKVGRRPGDDKPDQYGRRPDGERPDDDHPGKVGRRPTDDEPDTKVKTVTVIRSGKVVKETVKVTDDHPGKVGRRPGDDKPDQYGNRPDGRRPGDDQPDQYGRKPDGRRPEDDEPDQYGRRPDRKKPGDDQPDQYGRRPDGRRPEDDQPDQYGKRPDGRRPGDDQPDQYGSRPDGRKPGDDQPDQYGRRPDGRRPEDDQPDQYGRRPGGRRPGDDQPDQYGRRPDGKRPEDDQPDQYGRRPDGSRPGDDQPDQYGRRPDGRRPEDDHPGKVGRRPGDDQPDQYGRRPDGGRPGDDQPDQYGSRPDGRKPGDDQPDQYGRRPDGRRPCDDQPDQYGRRPDGKRPEDDQPDQYGRRPDGRRPGDDQPDQYGSRPDGRKPGDDQPDQYGRRPDGRRPEDDQPDQYGRRPDGRRPGDDQPDQYGRRPDGRRPEDDQPDQYGRRPDGSRPGDDQPDQYGRRPDGRRPEDDHPGKVGRRPGDDQPDQYGKRPDGRRPEGDQPDQYGRRPDGGRPGDDQPDQYGRRPDGRRPEEDHPGKVGRRPGDDQPDQYGRRPDGRRPEDDHPGKVGKRPGDSKPDQYGRRPDGRRPDDDHPGKIGRRPGDDKPDQYGRRPDGKRPEDDHPGKVGRRPGDSRPNEYLNGDLPDHANYIKPGVRPGKTVPLNKKEPDQKTKKPGVRPGQTVTTVIRGSKLYKEIIPTNQPRHDDFDDEIPDVRDKKQKPRKLTTSPELRSPIDKMNEINTSQVWTTNETNKVSVDISATHNQFASSLRAPPLSPDKEAPQTKPFTDDYYPTYGHPDNILNKPLHRKTPEKLQPLQPVPVKLVQQRPKSPEKKLEPKRYTPGKDRPTQADKNPNLKKPQRPGTRDDILDYDEQKRVDSKIKDVISRLTCETTSSRERRKLTSRNSKTNIIKRTPGVSPTSTPGRQTPRKDKPRKKTTSTGSSSSTPAEQDSDFNPEEPQIRRSSVKVHMYGEDTDFLETEKRGYYPTDEDVPRDSDGRPIRRPYEKFPDGVTDIDKYPGLLDGQYPEGFPKTKKPSSFPSQKDKSPLTNGTSSPTHRKPKDGHSPYSSSVSPFSSPERKFPSINGSPDREKFPDSSRETSPEGRKKPKDTKRDSPKKSLTEYPAQKRHPKDQPATDKGKPKTPTTPTTPKKPGTVGQPHNKTPTATKPKLDTGKPGQKTPLDRKPSDKLLPQKRDVNGFPGSKTPSKLKPEQPKTPVGQKSPTSKTKTDTPYNTFPRTPGKRSDVPDYKSNTLPKKPKDDVEEFPGYVTTTSRTVKSTIETKNFINAEVHGDKKKRSPRKNIMDYDWNEDAPNDFLVDSSPTSSQENLSPVDSTGRKPHKSTPQSSDRPLKDRVQPGSKQPDRTQPGYMADKKPKTPRDSDISPTKPKAKEPEKKPTRGVPKDQIPDRKKPDESTLFMKKERRGTLGSSENDSSDEEVTPGDKFITGERKPRPVQDEKYLTQIDMIRREQETTYGTKLFTTQDNTREPVGTVELPKSSRESTKSPDVERIKCSPVNEKDTEELRPRYADKISEPEEEGDFDFRRRSPRKHPETLIEEDEGHPKKSLRDILVKTTLEKLDNIPSLSDVGDDLKETVNISVAERVNKFMETALKPNSRPDTTRPEDITLKGLDDTLNEYIQHKDFDDTDVTQTQGTTSVLKAKSMFETIANQTVVTGTAKRELLRQDDILSRPSIFQSKQPKDHRKPTDDGTPRYKSDAPSSRESSPKRPGDYPDRYGSKPRKPSEKDVSPDRKDKSPERYGDTRRRSSTRPEDNDTRKKPSRSPDSYDSPRRPGSKPDTTYNRDYPGDRETSPRRSTKEPGQKPRDSTTSRKVPDDKSSPRHPSGPSDHPGSSPRRPSDRDALPNKPGQRPLDKTTPQRTSYQPGKYDSRPEKPKSQFPDHYDVKPGSKKPTTTSTRHPSDQDKYPKTPLSHKETTPKRKTSPDSRETSPRRPDYTTSPSRKTKPTRTTSPDSRDTSPRRPDYTTSPSRKTKPTRTTSPDSRDTSPRRPDYTTSPSRKTKPTRTTSPDSRDTSPRRPDYTTSPSRKTKPTRTTSPDSRDTSPRRPDYTTSPSRKTKPTTEKDMPYGSTYKTPGKRETSPKTTDYYGSTPSYTSPRKPSSPDRRDSLSSTPKPRSYSPGRTDYSPDRLGNYPRKTSPDRYGTTPYERRPDDRLSSPTRRPSSSFDSPDKSPTKKSPSKELADQVRGLSSPKKDSLTSPTRPGISGYPQSSRPFDRTPSGTLDKFSPVDRRTSSTIISTTSRVTSTYDSFSSRDKTSPGTQRKPLFESKPKMNGYTPGYSPFGDTEPTLLSPSSDKPNKIPENSVLRAPALLKKQKEPEDKRYTTSVYKTLGDSYPDTNDKSPYDHRTSKFGVTLKKTTSGGNLIKKGPVDVGKKETELDRTYDLDILQAMLERAKGYEERRLIRGQIRNVKNMIERNELPQSAFRRPSDFDSPRDLYRTSPERHTTYRSEITTETTVRTSSPDRYQPREGSPGKYPIKSTANLILSPKSTTTTPQRRSPEKQPGFGETRPSYKTYPNDTTRPGTKGSPSREVTGTLIDSETRKRSIEKRRSLASPERKPTGTFRDNYPENKTFSGVNKSIKKPHTEHETRETRITDSVISSYGVGPTDEKGRPLFGLQALRRQKGKPDVDTENYLPSEVESPLDIKDSSGRSFFGLKALRSLKTESSPLSERLNNDPDPHGESPLYPSRFDSYFPGSDDHKDEDEISRLMGEPGQSLKDMIRKHERLMDGDHKRPDSVSSSYSTSTVIKSSAVRRPDGTYSVKQNIVRGETTAKNDEEPQTRVTTEEYSYETPDREPLAITDVDNDNERSFRRKSTKSITSRSSTSDSIHSRDATRTTRKSSTPERKSTDRHTTSSTRLSTDSTTSYTKSRDDVDKSRKSISDRLTQLSKKFSNDNLEPSRKPSGRDTSESQINSYTRTSTSYRTTSSPLTDSYKYEPDNDMPDRKWSDDDISYRRGSSTPIGEVKETLQRKFSGADDSDHNSMSFTRVGKGGSVKALSQKFQQVAAEAEVPKSATSYPKAGLILRSTSFNQKNGELTSPDSPGYKQSVSMEVRVGSPTRSGGLTSSRTDYGSDLGRSWSPGRADREGDICERRTYTQTTEIRSDGGKSFLGNSSKVTGVQDIINRMRAADHEDDMDQTANDSEARALLNKFLGASVMMSGMEPLVKASGATTLVSQVERQRILGSPTGTHSKDYITEALTDTDNIDNIWSERTLRELLDACTDYEGRRKLRARLRTVMAEKSACEDLVAATRDEEDSKHLGDSAKTVRQGESLLPYFVEQLRTSLSLDPRSNSSPSSEEGTNAPHVEDSGTESGEDLRLLAGLRDSINEEQISQKNEIDSSLLTEVQNTLKKLQTTLDQGLSTKKTLDPETRDNLLQLVVRLQDSLKMTPENAKSTKDVKSPNKNRFASRKLLRQNRHTVGVTREELADARRLLEQNGLGRETTFLSERPTTDGKNNTTKAAETEKSDDSFDIVKQNSAGELYSNSSHKAFKPVQFSPTKSKAPSVLSNASAKPFCYPPESQANENHFQKYLQSYRKMSENSALQVVNPLSVPSGVSNNVIAEMIKQNGVSTEGNNLSSPLSPEKIVWEKSNLYKSTSAEQKSNATKNEKTPPSPPLKNIQYAPEIGAESQKFSSSNSNPSNYAKYNCGQAETKIGKENSDSEGHSLAHSKTMEMNGSAKPRLYKQSMSEDHGSSILEYDPSLRLFTPEQSVRIAVHQAAINKQLSLEEEKRKRQLSVESDLGSSDDDALDDDGDISSENGDEDLSVKQLKLPQTKMAPSNQAAINKQAVMNGSMRGLPDQKEIINSSRQLTAGERDKEQNNKNLNRFEKRLQEFQNENKMKSRPNARSIEELQKAYTERKEREAGRKLPGEFKTDLVQNAQAKYEKNLARQDPPSEAHHYQRNKLNSHIRSKYDYAPKKNDDDGLSVKLKNNPIYSAPDYSRTNGGSINFGSDDLMEASQTESEMSVSSTSTESSMCHAQKLLQMATNDEGSRYRNRSGKKSKMKRANTIDIPKPFNFYEVEDDTDLSDEERNPSRQATPMNGNFSAGYKLNNVPPQLQPKTESDRRFLAFLAKQSQPVVSNTIWKKDQIRDPSHSEEQASFSDQQWGSRFSRIKTAFENPVDKKFESKPKAASSARTFWKTADDSAAVIKPKGEFYAKANGPRLTRQGSQFLKKMFEKERTTESLPKAPWTNASNENVVVGSLTVCSQSPEANRKFVQTPAAAPKVNQFHHAPMSAFKLVQKKAPVATVDNQKIVPTSPSAQSKFNSSAKQMAQNFQGNKSPVSPTLPWIKDNEVKHGERSVNSTLAKFETLSQGKNQDHLDSYSTPAGSPLYLIRKSPSQPSMIQQRRESFTSSYPNAMVSSSKPVFTYQQPTESTPYAPPSVKDKIRNFQYSPTKNVSRNDAQKTLESQRANSNPPTTYSVDVAATSTVYGKYEEPSRETDLLQFYDAETGASTPEEHVAVTRVMGSGVQQQAVTIKQKTHRRDDDECIENRSSAVRNLANVLQRFSSPTDQQEGELCKLASPSRSTVPDSRHSRSPLLPPKLPTGKTSPVSLQTGARSESHDKNSVLGLRKNFDNKLLPHTPFRRTSSGDTLIASSSSEELKENGDAIITSRLQIPFYVGQSPNKASSLQDLSPANSPTRSPVTSSPSPSSIQKSESWHQLNEQLKPKRPQSLYLPNLPTPQRRTPNSLIKTKSSHALGFGGKQFEATMAPATVETKQKTVSEYFAVKKHQSPKPKVSPAKKTSPELLELDDNLENVDEAFDALFSSVTSSGSSSKRHSKSESNRTTANQIVKSTSATSVQHTRNHSSSVVTTKSGPGSSTRVITKTSSYTTSSTSSTNKPISPFAKFQQLDRQSSSSSAPSSPCSGKAPLFTFTDPKLSRSASSVKDRLLYWCQVKTKNYKNIQIENFSTSWSNGLAFCALIHHFRPEAFDYDSLNPKERRKNFELAFRVADEQAGIAPLLDVEDMVMMKKPDWKCVFTYVQSIYRRFKDEEI